MATDVERLVVSLEASMTKYERTMQRALGVTNSTMQKIERRNVTMSQRLERGYSGLQRGLAAAFGGALALRGAQQLVDASTRIENSLKVVGLAGEELTRVYDDLFKSAQRNFAPIESLTTLFSRLGLAQKELGASTDDLLSFTDNVAIALRVQGTTAQEARGALIQLSQAMGSGIVRAEEFNSVVEGAPSILRATAAGLVEAGGSVAKLRTLVVDGKLSSKAFFDAFQAGSVILKDQLAGAEVTVSQGFVRLQNVLIDTAGKFDNATNASQRIAGFLEDLSGSIESVGNAADANGPAINRFLDFILGAGDDLGNSMLAGVNRDIEAIESAVDALAAGFDKYGASVTDAELATAQAEQALATFATNGAAKFGELEPVVDDFIQQLLEGRGTAESAAEAIEAIGDAGDFGSLITDLSGLVDALFSVRSEAVATAAAVAAAARGENAGTNIAGQRAEQLANRPKAAPKPVSLSDYDAPVGSGGKSGGGKSKADQFATAVANQEREIADLQRKTQLQATLNHLVNDYGYAMERLNAQIELENAATEAGLPLDEQRRGQIEQLASGYAMATSEAARLAEAQDRAKESADALAQAGQQAMDTVVDGLLEGRDAGEILNDVLKDLTRSLIDIGINMIKSNIGSLLGGVFGGGGGLQLGYQSGIPGFASGTSNTGGARGQVRGVVHGQEAVIPLPGGGRVPVDLRMPSLPQVGGGQSVVRVELGPDLEGRILQRSGAQSIQIVQSSAPAIAEQGANAAGAKLGSGDFDGSMRRYGVAAQAKVR